MITHSLPVVPHKRKKLGSSTASYGGSCQDDFPSPLGHSSCLCESVTKETGKKYGCRVSWLDSSTNHLGGLRTVWPWSLSSSPVKKERLALIARMLEHFEEVPGVWFDLGKVTPVTQACWEAL